MVEWCVGQLVPVVAGGDECQTGAAESEGGTGCLSASAAGQGATAPGRERCSHPRPQSQDTGAGGGDSLQQSYS